MSSSVRSPFHQVTEPLPVFETARRAILTVFAHPGVVIRLVWGWAVVLAALYAMIWVPNGPGARMLYILALVAGVVVALSSVAVGWHRFLLLGERPGWLYLAAGPNVFRYVIAAAFLLLITAIAQLILDNFISSLFRGESAGSMRYLFSIALGLAIPCLLLPRISLVLPAHALGVRMTQAEARQISRGHTLRFGLATALVLLPLYVVDEISPIGSPFGLVDVGDLGLPHPLYIGFTLGALVIHGMVILATVGLISLTYNHVAPSAR
jgi:hypothetical protein